MAVRSRLDTCLRACFVGHGAGIPLVLNMPTNIPWHPHVLQLTCHLAYIYSRVYEGPVQERDLIAAADLSRTGESEVSIHPLFQLGDTGCNMGAHLHIFPVFY